MLQIYTHVIAQSNGQRIIRKGDTYELSKLEYVLAVW